MTLAEWPRFVTWLTGEGGGGFGRCDQAMAGATPPDDAPRRLLALTAIALACALGAAGGAEAAKPPETVPGAVIVRFAPSADGGDRARARRAADAHVEDDLRRELPGLQVLHVDPGDSVRDAIEHLERRDDVLYAEPDTIVHGAAVPNDSRFPEQYALPAIHAPEAWDIVHDAPNVKVAVVDSGFYYDHPDLAPNTWHNHREVPGNGVDDDGNGFVDDTQGWDFVGDDNDPAGTHPHGTWVAGLIGARGDNDSPGPGTTDVTGVAWRTQLVNVRVLDSVNRSRKSNAIRGLIYAARSGAPIVNASLGGAYPSQAERDALTLARDTLFVISAGNEATDVDSKPQYPCAYDLPNVICVAATNQADALASFSNYGAGSVDLAAPGEGILTTHRTNQLRLNEDFETDAGARWVTGGVNNTWARGSELPGEGSWSATDSPGGDYQNDTNSWLRTANPVDLSGVRRCAVNYMFNQKLEGQIVPPGEFVATDRVLVEAATDPNGSWTRLGEIDDITPGTAFNFGGHDLGAFSGQSGVYLRFRLVTDGSVTGDGVHIDGIVVNCADLGFSDKSYLSVDGTSFAAPEVAGVAALILARYPAAGVADLRHAILASVDRRPSLAGKVATGGRLNAHRALVGVQRALDPDGDRVVSKVDDCPRAADPRQADSDLDSRGDACDPDDDDDGLPDRARSERGAARIDVDSDDDGLSDAHEARVTHTRPRRFDSDRDGISDGVELGVTGPLAAPPGAVRGTSARRFRPDRDPATRTNPWLADSDRDGRPDGAEDANRNGRRDPGEGDPLS
jgi:thermitase